jgi:hypothetical protein
MKQIKTILFVLLLALAINPGVVWADSNKKIKIKIDYLDLSEKVRIGNLPIGLNDGELQKLFPELKHPRQMLPKDIEKQDDLFVIFTQGLTFVLKGDFNHDGIADVVFSGKYLADDNKKEKGFVAVISFPPGGFVEREYLEVFDDEILALDRLYHYKPGIDGIVIYGILRSEEIYILFWTGFHYSIKMAPGTEKFYAPLKDLH